MAGRSEFNCLFQLFPNVGFVSRLNIIEANVPTSCSILPNLFQTAEACYISLLMETEAKDILYYKFTWQQSSTASWQAILAGKREKFKLPNYLK